VNANDATLTSLATAQTGSTVPDTAPNAPASPGFDLVLQAAAGSALGGCGAPYTLTLSAIDLTTVTQPWPPAPSTRPSTKATAGHCPAPAPTISAPRPSPYPSPATAPAAHWPATPSSTSRP
jgi:hypothetical protein